MSKYVFLTVLLLSLFLFTWAETNIPAGNVSGTWTSINSPYNILGIIIIPHGQTLTIQPGVDIRFVENASLNVSGRLLAQGTEQDSIHFNSLVASQKWSGICFDSTSVANDSTFIFYSVIERSNNSGINISNFSKIRISNTRISNNMNATLVHIVAPGVDVYVAAGGGIFCYYSSPLISNNIIRNNSASDGTGGGIFCFNDSPAIINNVITYNTAGAPGGGIYSGYSSPLIIGNLVAHNTSTDNNAGGICVDSDGDGSIINNTIVYNTASGHGGGIKCGGSSPTLTNNIIWGNIADEGNQVSLGSGSYNSQPVISYCNIEDGLSDFHYSDVPYNTSLYTDNIDQNPLFFNPANSDYTLSTGSLCIDAGIPNVTGLNLPLVDLAGCSRIWDGNGDSIARIDIGAYEYGAPVSINENSIPSTLPSFCLTNYPNPFKHKTTISFNQHKSGQTVLNIYNIRGQLVRKLINETKSAGQQTVTWDGKDDRGMVLASGIYLCRISSAGKHESRKMILQR